MSRKLVFQYSLLKNVTCSLLQYFKKRQENYCQRKLLCMKFDACSKTKQHCFNLTNLEMIESIGHYSTIHRGKKNLKMLMQINSAPTLSSKDFIFFYKKKLPKNWGGGRVKKPSTLTYNLRKAKRHSKDVYI